MSYVLNGIRITQSGTDTDFSDLASITGVETCVAGNHTTYLLNNLTLFITGTQSHDPDLETLSFNFTADGSPSMRVDDTGTYNYGVKVTVNGIDNYSKGTGLIFSGEVTHLRGVWDANRFGGLQIFGGNFNAMGGTILTAKTIGFSNDNANHSLGGPPTIVIESLVVRKILTTQNREVRFDSNFVLAGSSVTGLVTDGIRISHRSLPHTAFEAEILNTEIIQLAHATQPTYTIRNLEASNNITDQADFLCDSLTGVRGNFVKTYNVFNSSKGSETVMMPKADFEDTRQLGILNVYRTISFNVSSDDGRGLGGYKVYCIDSDSGFRKNENSQDNTGDFVYIFTGASTGDIGLSNSLDILCATTNVHRNGFDFDFDDWDTSVDENNYRVDRRFGATNIARFFMWHYSHVPAILQQSLTGTGDVQVEWTMFPDTSILTDLTTISAVSNVLVSQTNGSVTVSAGTDKLTLQELRDYLRYYKTLDANLDYPTPDTEIATVDGQILDFGSHGLNGLEHLTSTINLSRVRTTGIINVADVEEDLEVHYTRTGVFESLRLNVIAVDPSYITIHRTDTSTNVVSNLTVPTYTTSLTIPIGENQTVTIEIEAFGYRNFTATYTTGGTHDIHLVNQTVMLTADQADALNSATVSGGWSFTSGTRTLDIHTRDITESSFPAILERIETLNPALNDNNESIWRYLNEDTRRISVDLNININNTTPQSPDIDFLQLTNNYTLSGNLNAFDIPYSDSTGTSVIINITTDNNLKYGIIEDSVATVMPTVITGVGAKTITHRANAGVVVGVRLQSLGYFNQTETFTVLGSGNVLNVSMRRINQTDGTASFQGSARLNGFAFDETNDLIEIHSNQEFPLNLIHVFRDQMYHLEFNRGYHESTEQIILNHSDSSIILGGGANDTMFDIQQMTDDFLVEFPIAEGWTEGFPIIQRTDEFRINYKFEPTVVIADILQQQTFNERMANVPQVTKDTYKSEGGVSLSVTAVNPFQVTANSLAGVPDQAYTDYIVEFLDNNGNVKFHTDIIYFESNTTTGFLTLWENPQNRVISGDSMRLVPSQGRFNALTRGRFVTSSDPRYILSRNTLIVENVDPLDDSLINHKILVVFTAVNTESDARFNVRTIMDQTIIGSQSIFNIDSNLTFTPRTSDIYFILGREDVNLEDHFIVFGEVAIGGTTTEKARVIMNNERTLNLDLLAGSVVSFRSDQALVYMARIDRASVGTRLVVDLYFETELTSDELDAIMGTTARVHFSSGVTASSDESDSSSGSGGFTEYVGTTNSPIEDLDADDNTIGTSVLLSQSTSGRSRSSIANDARYVGSELIFVTDSVAASHRITSYEATGRVHFSPAISVASVPSGSEVLIRPVVTTDIDQNRFNGFMRNVPEATKAMYRANSGSINVGQGIASSGNSLVINTTGHSTRVFDGFTCIIRDVDNNIIFTDTVLYHTVIGSTERLLFFQNLPPRALLLNSSVNLIPNNYNLPYIARGSVRELGTRTTFRIWSGSTRPSSYTGLTVFVAPSTNVRTGELRKIINYSSNATVTVDRPLSFTPATDDFYIIMPNFVVEEGLTQENLDDLLRIKRITEHSENLLLTQAGHANDARNDIVLDWSTGGSLFYSLTPSVGDANSPITSSSVGDGLNLFITFGDMTLTSDFLEIERNNARVNTTRFMEPILVGVRINYRKRSSSTREYITIDARLSLANNEDGTFIDQIQNKNLNNIIIDSSDQYITVLFEISPQISTLKIDTATLYVRLESTTADPVDLRVSPIFVQENFFRNIDDTFLGIENDLTDIVGDIQGVEEIATQTKAHACASDVQTQQR